MRLWHRALLWLAALASCVLVFAWYLQPEMLVALANQVWACF